MHSDPSWWCACRCNISTNIDVCETAERAGMVVASPLISDTQQRQLVLDAGCRKWCMFASSD
jgi:hypothetical protein